MAVQSSFYIVDGSTRTFPSTKHIASKQHCSIHLKDSTLLTWSIANTEDYSLINNSVVFDIAPSSSQYSEIEVRIADTQNELIDSPSNIAIVAGNILDVNTVATNIDDINTIGDNINALLVIPANLTAINNISTNIVELLTIDDSATTATAMASTVASIYDQFDDRYLGSKAVAPSLDNDNNALLIGALYFDTTTNLMKVYGSSGWVSAGSSVNGTTERHTYSATAGQTSFLVNYESGYVDVYLNGSKLQAGVDFTATSGTSIILSSVASVGDIVDIISYGVFEVANTTPKGNEAYTVSTVADLVSVPSSYTTAIVKDLDRGGTFIWSSTGTANGGTVFAGATGFWTRQYSGAVNVKWFGAKGDDATDDLIAFNNAILFINDNNLHSLMYIPSGTYIISGELLFTKAVDAGANRKTIGIYGEGTATTLKHSGSSSHFLSWDAERSTATSFAGVIIRDLNIENSGTCQNGIFLNGANYCDISNITVSYFINQQVYIAASDGGTTGGLWSNCSNITVNGGLIGIETQSANSWSFNRVNLLTSVNYGMYINSTNNVISGVSVVPSGAATSYVALRCAGLTTVSGFEYENPGGGVIGTYLIDVIQGWLYIDSISTRSISTAQVLGSSNNLGVFQNFGNRASNGSIAPLEHSSDTNYPINIYSSSSRVSDTNTFAVNLVGEGSLELKPIRKSTVTATVGVNSVFSAYQNLYTSDYKGAAKYVTPNVIGIKIICSGIATTVEVAAACMNGTTIAGSTVTTYLSLGSLANGTYRMTYDQYVQLFDAEIAVQRIQFRARVPEATYTGSVSISLIYKYD